ncbi:iron transporter [Janthinobacterium sp. RB2R34]|uniref:iron transporter n=1 Tax=Janthinobacterium sp. RB2R34 TaxID=3424193 RepID=UPI003F266DB3
MIASTTLRVVGAIGGGYAVTALAVTTAGAVLAHLGMARSDAVVTAAMLGFVVYLLLLLWGFAVRSPARLWLTLAGSAALLMAVRHLLT